MVTLVPHQERTLIMTYQPKQPEKTPGGPGGGGDF